MSRSVRWVGAVGLLVWSAGGVRWAPRWGCAMSGSFWWVLFGVGVGVVAWPSALWRGRGDAAWGWRAAWVWAVLTSGGVGAFVVGAPSLGLWWSAYTAGVAVVAAPGVVFAVRRRGGSCGAPADAGVDGGAS